MVFFTQCMHVPIFIPYSAGEIKLSILSLKITSSGSYLRSWRYNNDRRESVTGAKVPAQLTLSRHSGVLVLTGLGDQPNWDTGLSFHSNTC